jgi:predicted metal-dependent hydrolase
VRPDKSVVVKAPTKSKHEEIQIKLRKRGQWILKQINYFDKFHPIQPEREYVSGETHYYLGRQYRLRIEIGNEDTVKLIGKYFIVTTKKPENSEHTKLLMRHWYADHAKLISETRVMRYIDRILGSGFGTIEISYKYLKRRWGYLNPNGSLTFNIELIKTPLLCVDYVLVHELCHIVHPNHDKVFYRLMGRIMPDWRKRKEKLELFGVK